MTIQLKECSRITWKTSMVLPPTRTLNPVIFSFTKVENDEVQWNAILAETRSDLNLICIMFILVCEPG